MVKHCVNSPDANDPGKKRKKEETKALSPSKVSSLSTGEADRYKSIIQYEATEANERDPEDDMQLFQVTCDKLQKLIYDIDEFKARNTDQEKAVIASKRVEGSLQFVVLKKLNRLEKFRMKESRDTLHRVKQQVNSHHLHLQNLLYEILHLRKEVNKCLQFKSKDEEIELVPVEEFYKDSPETLSRPEVTRNDSHQLKLARLEWELRQRQQLAELCRVLQAGKEEVATEIQQKRTNIDNLAPMLKDILAVTKPVQDNLGLPLAQIRKQHQLAYLLPHPLYFLYVQADAHREASDKVISSVTVSGDEEEAQRMKTTVTEPMQQEDSDSDPQEEASSKRHHRKKSRVDRQQDRKKQLLLKHPLTVDINIKLKDESSILLKFSYLINLHIVTLKTTVEMAQPIHGISAGQLVCSENVLADLFPEDDGVDSPNLANHYQLKQVGLESLDTSSLGMPYVWVQRVAGLDFAGGSGGKVEAKSAVSQASLPSVMTAVKRRLRARLALAMQVQSLEGGTMPPMGPPHGYLPAKLSCVLSQWQSLPWTDYCSLAFTGHHVATCSVSPSDLFYRALVTRASARMTFVVAVKSDYPSLTPVFAVQLQWNKATLRASNCDVVRDMEREVNVHWLELLKEPGWTRTLLASLVHRLMTCFDVFLESRGPLTEFHRGNTFLQASRGRNRAVPYKYIKTGEGIFIQR